MQDKLLTAFEAQRRACDMLGSPLTAAIVGFCRDDFAAGGPVADLVRGWQGDPLDDNVPLRLAGFVHFLALGGDAISRFFQAAAARFRREMKKLYAPIYKNYFSNSATGRARLFAVRRKPMRRAVPR